MKENILPGTRYTARDTTYETRILGARLKFLFLCEGGVCATQTLVYEWLFLHVSCKGEPQTHQLSVLVAAATGDFLLQLDKSLGSENSSRTRLSVPARTTPPEHA